MVMARRGRGVAPECCELRLIPSAPGETDALGHWPALVRCYAVLRPGSECACARRQNQAGANPWHPAIVVSISLTPITNPSPTPGQASLLPSQIYPIPLHVSPWRFRLASCGGKLALPGGRLTGETWRPSLATAGTRVGLMTLPGRFEAPWSWPTRARGCAGVLPLAGSGQVLRRTRWLGVMPRRVQSQTELPERYGVS